MEVSRYMQNRFGALAPLAVRLQGFARVNRQSNPRRADAADKALGLLQLADWAYGEKRAEYLAKAQGAFRLAFM